MRLGPRYFVDTSVWIPYLGGTESEYGDAVDQLIEENRIFINGIVIVELLKGSRSSEEFDRLASALSGLIFIGGNGESFLAAGRNGHALKKKGLSVPLSDLIIATDCIESGLILIERDAHFGTIAEHLPLNLHT
jgi:tRNA(fMet)-specific endonuclease VapC